MVLPEDLDGGVRPASKILTLFMTKICNFIYRTYDLTKKMDSLFMIVTVGTVALNIMIMMGFC